MLNKQAFFIQGRRYGNRSRSNSNFTSITYSVLCMLQKWQQLKARCITQSLSAVPSASTVPPSSSVQFSAWEDWVMSWDWRVGWCVSANFCLDWEGQHWSCNRNWSTRSEWYDWAMVWSRFHLDSPLIKYGRSGPVLWRGSTCVHPQLGFTLVGSYILFIFV